MKTLAPLGVALALLGCVEPPPPATPAANVRVEVPEAVIAAHAAELPLSLYVRRTPGTLANRGILLATICEPGAALATVYVWRPESPSEQVEAWIEPSYADDPNTPCEITPEPLRRTRIVAGPTGRPIASAPLAPGGRATLVLADAP
ncbi:MAG: hypothetical protein H6719_16405 [Sandaracinaceae bacterium]|nr:hypothetical protein [Sandaracinaceae bacterium]